MPQTDPERIPRRPPGEQPDDHLKWKRDMTGERQKRAERTKKGTDRNRVPELRQLLGFERGVTLADLDMARTKVERGYGQGKRLTPGSEIEEGYGLTDRYEGGRNEERLCVCVCVCLP